MNIKLPAAVYGVLLAALGAPLAAHARQAGPADNPADPAAPVPALTYVSVLHDAALTDEPALTPDKLWRAANAAMRAAPDHDGHAGHGAPRPAEPAHLRPAPAAPAAPQPASKAAPQPPEAGHARHHHPEQGKT